MSAYVVTLSGSARCVANGLDHMIVNVLDSAANAKNVY